MKVTIDKGVDGPKLHEPGMCAPRTILKGAIEGCTYMLVRHEIGGGSSWLRLETGIYVPGAISGWIVSPEAIPKELVLRF